MQQYFQLINITHIYIHIYSDNIKMQATVLIINITHIYIAITLKCMQRYL
jgi:hypothetical protein